MNTTNSDSPTREEMRQAISQAADKAIQAAMKGTGDVLGQRLNEISKRFDDVERSGHAVSELIGLQSETIQILRDQVERLRERMQEFDQELNAMKATAGENP